MFFSYVINHTVKCNATEHALISTKGEKTQ